jgi:hypothetical protein
MSALSKRKRKKEKKIKREKEWGGEGIQEMKNLYTSFMKKHEIRC